MVITNEQLMKKFINLSIFILIWPPTKCKSTLGLKFFQMCSILSAISLTVLFIWATNGRYYLIYKDGSLAPILSLLDQTSHTFLHVSSLMSSISFTFCFRKSYQDFSEKLNKISKVLENPWNRFTNVFKLFMVFLIFLTTALTYDAYVWLSTLGIDSYQYYILKTIQAFQLSINAFIIFGYSLLMKSIFKKLNEKFKYEMDSRLDEYNSIFVNEITFRVSNSQLFNKKCTYREMSWIIRAHNELCNLVDEFNSVFGLNMLFVVFNCIVNVLFNAGLCVVYALMSGKNLSGVNYGTDLMISRFQWITVFLVLPVMLAISCGSAEKEARRIIPLTLTYLNELPTKTKTDEDQLLKEQLNTLCKQAQLRSPEFSADGFFTVNRTMVGFIIGSVTSYIIVTLQLAGDNSSKDHYMSHVLKN